MPTGNTIRRFKLYHVLFWAALTGVWYFFRYEDYSSRKLAFEVTLLKVADLALMVYVTNYLLIPRLLYRKRYILFGLSFVLFVFGSSWLKMYLEGQLMHNPGLFDLFHRFKALFYDNTIPHFLLVSTGGGFKLIIDYAKAQKRMGEMAKENAEAELNFLKSQINPHFVFNSLNSVHFLIDRQNLAARDALLKFSDMLRYQLYECNGHKTGIEKEIAYLTDYVDLQRLRRDENCVVDLDCSPHLTGFRISPLLLIPFVENAFKHLSHYSNCVNKVSIHLKKEDGLMKFTVSNTTEEKAADDVLPHGGIGLKNVRRRLELLYPGKHSLVIDQLPDQFTILLTLNIE
jgi:two-component system LytT family sensor kinase